MSFRSDVIAILAGLLVLAAPSIGGDEVGDYLRSHGLNQLLALHLEEKLDAAQGEDRRKIAVQLASLYADLLESSSGLDEHIYFEKRGQELLAIVPEDEADKLRLALLQGPYSRVERIAENHRLRMSEDEKIAEATDTLTKIIPQFRTLRIGLDQQVEVLERRLNRASRTEATRMEAELDRLRPLWMRTTFLYAWALYYQSWFTDRPEAARLAEEMFGVIIDPDVRRVRLEEVSIDLLDSEAFARSVLGTALCKSLTSRRVEEALQWLELLEREQAYEPLKENLPAWRLAILLEHGEFRWAKNLIDELRSDSDEELPIVYLRLAAVHAMEAADADPDAAALAREAIADLAGRGELQQVLDLADRYGVEPIGAEGFVVLYVRGAQRYQQARDLHGGDEPTPRSDVGAHYQAASEFFSQAVSEEDAGQFPVAAAAARSLIGWCHYFQGKFFEAKDAFKTAAATLPPDEASQALWMAILSLDHVVQTDTRPSTRRELENLISIFLQRYPASKYAPRLVLRQSEGVAEPSMDLVEQLLSIPPNSDSYESAQRRAAQTLYRLFRDAEEGAQSAVGERYIRVALPIFARTEATALADDLRRQAFLVRARRILDVALRPEIRRVEAAQEVFERLDHLAEAGEIDLRDHVNELEYRRFQIHLYAGPASEADRYADRLWERDGASPWAIAAAQQLFRDALREWREAGERDDDRIALDRIVRYGGKLLRHYEESGRTLDDEQIIVYYARVADASWRIWRRSGDEEMGRRALFLYNKLLEARPSNAQFLRSFATLAQAFGDESNDRQLQQSALDAWRKLAGGLAAGTDEWFEAKYNQVLLLTELDSELARDVLGQLKVLYPGFGPDPWKERFESLEQRLQTSDAAGSTSDEGGSG